MPVVSDGIILKLNDSIEGFMSYSHLFSVPHESNRLRLKDFFARDARQCDYAVLPSICT